MSAQTRNAQAVQALTGRIAGRPLHVRPPPGAHLPTGVEALALHWFAKMREGKIDRTQLAPEYDAHLTDHAIEKMSHFLKRHEFGHLPLEAHVMQSRDTGAQKIHIVKIHFPRGDAASLMIGLNSDDKITGV